MKDVKPADVPENVIEFDFRKTGEDIPVDIMFPACKRFPTTEEAADSLADSLLSEFDSLVNSHDFTSDYIHHHTKLENYNVEFSDSNKLITEKIIKQLTRLKEDSRRIKYYLDEIDMES